MSCRIVTCRLDLGKPQTSGGKNKESVVAIASLSRFHSPVSMREDGDEVGGGDALRNGKTTLCVCI
jgi:hypothetical protein